LLTKKALIVGASGFLGRRVYERFQKAGYDVMGTQTQSQLKDRIYFDLSTDRIENRIQSTYLKTTDQTKIPVVITSALSQLDQCKKKKDLSYAINVTGTKRLIDDLKNFDAQILFISSSFVFNGQSGNYSEKDTPDPISEYGQQKLEIERYLTLHDPSALIFRIDKLLGDQIDEKHVFSEWNDWLNRGEPIPCIAGQVFSPTNVSDIAEAAILGLEKNLTGIYHVANS
jgi:dTDP-4-dehydrorhamnose reductase